MTDNTTTIGVMMPADMGGAVAALLKQRGARVVTNLESRSPRTRGLAEQARAEDLGSDEALVAQCDIILSIIAPSGAIPLAERLAPAIKASGKPIAYADCNAIAPDTARAIGSIIEQAGGRFVDAGIIGPPPRKPDSRTIFYASGPAVEEMGKLRQFGLDVSMIGGRTGDASAVKMCYAAMTKGSAALMTQLIVTARRLGVIDTLMAEFEASQAAQLKRMRNMVPSAVPKAFRWVAEMEEIAKTFAAEGITPAGFQGAADIFQGVAETDLGRMKVEEWAEANLDFEEVINGLAKSLPKTPRQA